MATFTNQSKSSTTFANQSKSSTTFANQSRITTEDFLLLEDGGYMLQENGDKIILEQSVATYTNWANQTKN